MEHACSLLFSSLLFSCEEIKEQNEIYESKISSPTDLPLAASSVEFLALTESSEGNSVLANECDCEYRILDVDLPPLAPGNDRSLIELFAYDNCVGGAACPIFTTYFNTNTDPVGSCLDPFGNCHQDWADLLVGYEPFNCLIDANSQFYLFDFAAYQANPSCNPNNPGSPEITIAVRCEKVGSPSCGGTDTNIYTVPANMLYTTGYLAMGGKCGCVPHFLKFENPGDPS